MLKTLLTRLNWNLQLFEDGGDGGSAGDSASTSGENNGNSTDDVAIPSSIPERAKKYYAKAVKANKASLPKQADASMSQPTDDSVADNKATTPTDGNSFDELINNPQYKDDLDKFMNKAFGKRMSKYKGLEESYNKANSILGTVAQKYGLDSTSDTFMDDLNKAVSEDDSLYEKYALEHDMSTEDARKVVQLESKVKQFETQKIQNERQAEAQRQIQLLQENAQNTAAVLERDFGINDFNLEKELSDERFRKLCAATNGDTLSAYKTCHWDELYSRGISRSKQVTANQVTNAVKSNLSRPSENGMSSTAPSVVQNDFSKMSLKDLRAWANEQRQKSRGR